MDELINKLKHQGKYQIAFTGDSITSCEWVHPNWRDIVFNVLQNEATDLLDGDWKLAEWGLRGLNFAYDGAITKDILDMVDEEGSKFFKTKFLNCVESEFRNDYLKVKND